MQYSSKCRSRFPALSRSHPTSCNCSSRGTSSSKNFSPLDVAPAYLPSLLAGHAAKYARSRRPAQVQLSCVACQLAGRKSCAEQDWARLHFLVAKCGISGPIVDVAALAVYAAS